VKKIVLLLAAIALFSFASAIEVSCPSITLSATNFVLVTNYENNSFTCSGISLAAQGANGTALNASSIMQVSCVAGHANYSVALPSQGLFTVTASTASSSRNCTINYFNSQPNAPKLPEQNLFVVIAAGFLAAALYAGRNK